MPQPTAPQASSDSTDHPHHHYAGNHRAHHENIHRAHGQLHHSGRLSHREAGPAAEALAALGEQHGVSDRRAFVHAVHKLPVGRQHELVQHAGGVAAYLQVGAVGGVGVVGWGAA